MADFPNIADIFNPFTIVE
ncbi:hypothetical protein KIPB_014299, partial [Kipferlia bialata]|eukprot:g14299.t1